MYFLRDHVQCHINIEFVDTNHKLVDIFTKPLSEDRMNFIKHELAMIYGVSLT